MTDEEGAFALLCPPLSREDRVHQEDNLGAMFNVVRYVARTGCRWL